MLSFGVCAIFLISLSSVSYADTNVEEENSTGLHVIEGKILDFNIPHSEWKHNTKIHVNGGEFIGFVKKDGSFAVHNLPSGSYILDVLSPDYTLEPVRVEINSKGKFRARKVNHIQTSQVLQVPYPLRLKALGRTRYFQQREQWRITDFLFNPMILMMVLPLVLIMILPKMMNDPETKKEMEQINSLTNFEMPEMSDMVSNFLAGTSQNTQQNKKALKVKKRQ